MLQKYSSWAIFLDGDFVRPILCICFLILTHESFCILNETRMTGDVGMLWHVDIVAWVSVKKFICLFVSVCFFVYVSYSVHVLEFTVQGVDLWRLPHKKIFWGINVWGGVFRRRKREHAVCQDYWERFVFPANVKPFVFQYELFMPWVPRFVFLQKETIATFGHKLNLPSPCEILRLSNRKSVPRKISFEGAQTAKYLIW